MIRVKSIGRNPVIANVVNEKEFTVLYFNTDLGCFTYEFDFLLGRYVFFWIVKKDGNAPSEQDAIEEGINFLETL